MSIKVLKFIMVSGWIMKPRWYSVPPPSHSFVRKPSQNVSRVWGTILYNVHAFKKKKYATRGMVYLNVKSSMAQNVWN